ncbi:unnamed protein product [Phytophthora lilii]|uniref:Unnamed protein product n=1 Tax=Phytophthora lilii TaxID=2077276 RepID=A0A9W6TIZ6_9STRA|nr:unnamed protein product [Phytophthora lilii]
MFDTTIQDANNVALASAALTEMVCSIHLDTVVIAQAVHSGAAFMSSSATALTQASVDCTASLSTKTNNDTDMIIDSSRLSHSYSTDQVFRSTDSTITDEDIDAILAEGEQCTEEMKQNMQVYDKGGMFDFKLDGAGCQNHDGIDYSNERNARKN